MTIENYYLAKEVFIKTSQQYVNQRSFLIQKYKNLLIEYKTLMNKYEETFKHNNEYINIINEFDNHIDQLENLTYAEFTNGNNNMLNKFNQFMENNTEHKQLFDNYKELMEQYNTIIKEYETCDDVSELISNNIIPYFELFICDLENIIDTINNKTNNLKLILNFIELIFNFILYDTYLSMCKANANNNFTHYLIILAEFTKYEQYQKIVNSIKDLSTDTFVKYGISENENDQKELLDITNIKITRCLEKIKNTYSDLVTNFSTYENCKEACFELLSANNLFEKIN